MCSYTFRYVTSHCDRAPIDEQVRSMVFRLTGLTCGTEFMCTDAEIMADYEDIEEEGFYTHQGVYRHTPNAVLVTLYPISVEEDWYGEDDDDIRERDERVYLKAVDVINRLSMKVKCDDAL